MALEMMLPAQVAVEQPVRRERWMFGSGVAFAAVQFGALVYNSVFFFPLKPPLSAPPAEQAAFYAANGAILETANYLLALPVPFFLLFLGGLFAALRRIEGEGGALPLSAAGAGVATAIIWPFGCIMTTLGATIARAGGDAATVVALDGMAPLSLALSALPRAALLVATAIVLLRGRRSIRWIGWFGFALGAISVAGSATLVNAALFPLLGLSTLLFEVWVVSLSVALMKDTHRGV